MKTTRKMFSLMMVLLFVTSLGFVSCNNDDDAPQDSDIFVGQYTGQISYSNGDDEPIGPVNGNVEVVKVGDNYNFLFGEGIPDITGVEFESDGEVLINVGNNEAQFIRVTANSLEIFYTENENDVWTADCTR